MKQTSHEQYFEKTIYVGVYEDSVTPYFAVMSGAISYHKKTLEDLFDNMSWVKLEVEPSVESDKLVLEFYASRKEFTNLLGTFPQDSCEEIRKRYPEHFL